MRNYESFGPEYIHFQKPSSPIEMPFTGGKVRAHMVVIEPSAINEIAKRLPERYSAYFVGTAQHHNSAIIYLSQGFGTREQQKAARQQHRGAHQIFNVINGEGEVPSEFLQSLGMEKK